MALVAERVVTELVADTSGHDTKIRTSAQVVDQSATQIQRSATRAETAIRSSTTTIARGFDQTAQRSRLLGYQIADVGAQLAAGTSPFLVMAQQAPQVANALDGTTGAAGRMATFFSGPWGAALLAAGSILGTLLLRNRETGDTVEGLTRKLEQNARRAELTRQAHEAYGRTLPGVTAAIREQTEELQRQNRTLGENQALVLQQAQSNIARLETLRTTNIQAQSRARAEIARIQGQLGASGNDPRIAGPLRGELEAQQRELQRLIRENATLFSQLVAGQNAIREAQIPIIQGEVENSLDAAAAATSRYEAALARLNRQLRLNQISEADYRRDLTQAARQRDREIEAARQSERTARELVRPVTGAVMSQFGADRSGVPLNGRRVAGRTHQGVDLRGDLGDPVVAPTGGTVRLGNAPGGLGIYVEIRGPNGSRDILGHLSGTSVQSGQRVEAGQLVGQVGATGNAAGGPSHLHWQRMENGRWVDPMRRVGSSGAAQEAAQEAARLAREAEQRARNEAAFQDELAELNVALLVARRRDVQSAEEIAQFAQAELEAQRQRQNAAYEEAERQGRLTAAQREQLVSLNDQVAAARQAAIQSRLQQALDERRYQIAVSELRDAESIEQARGALVRTIAERRESELRLLDLSHQEELLAIDRARAQQGLTDEMRRRLDREEAASNERYGLARRGVEQRNMTPLQQFLDRAPGSARELDEALEGVAANGLSALNDGLATAIGNFIQLGGTAGRIVSQMITDIARLLIYQNVTAPFASALGGLFGGAGGGFDPIAFGAKAIAGGGLFGFASGGSGILGGRPGTDQNVLSLNGVPFAKVSRGERLSFTPQGATSGRPQVTVISAPQFDLRGVITTPALMAEIERVSQVNAARHAAAMGRGVLKAVPGRLQQFQSDGT